MPETTIKNEKKYSQHEITFNLFFVCCVTVVKNKLLWAIRPEGNKLKIEPQNGAQDQDPTAGKQFRNKSDE